MTRQEEGTSGPAPGRLEMAQCFVNTYDVEERRDELVDAARLEGWLADHDLLDDTHPVEAGDVAAAVAVREAIRGLLLANHGDPVDAGDVKKLNEAAEAAGLSLRFRPDGSSGLEPSQAGVSGSLGRILAVVFGAMADGSWDRLKVCRADDCRVAFYDHSKNHSRTWCSMAVCGNRAKARAWRRRKAARASGAEGTDR